MAKRILFCASTASHINNFHLPYLCFFKTKGWEVDVATWGQAVIPHTDGRFYIPFDKKMASCRNIQALLAMVRLLRDKKYDMISTHTALASLVVRLALFIAGKGDTSVIYTVHGYLFSENSGLARWIYILSEKLCAVVTDATLVMNEEDLCLTYQYGLSRSQAIYIPGMGLDLSKFSNVVEDREKTRQIYGFQDEDFLFLYAAELSKRKNQGELIKAMALISQEEKHIHLLLAGDGALKESYMQMTKALGVNDRVHLLGHVTDILPLYNMVDGVVSSSGSEGLPFNIMEGMTCGLPVVASRIKGHVDLLEDDFLYESGDAGALASKLLAVYRSQELRTKAGETNRQRVKDFTLDAVYPRITAIYETYIY